MRPQNRRVAIVAAAADYFGLSYREVIGGDLAHANALARHVSVYAIREALGCSWVQCAAAVRMGDHTTAGHGINRIKRALAGDGPIVQVRGALDYIGNVVFPGEGRWSL